MTSGVPLTDRERAEILTLNATRLYSRRQIAIKTGKDRHLVASVIDEWAAKTWNDATRSARMEDYCHREP